MLRKLRLALQRAFTPKPPDDLHSLFLYNVEQIRGYLTDFLLQSAEYQKSQLKAEEIGYYALFVASQGWRDSDLKNMTEELKALENRVLAKCRPETDDKMEVDFRRQRFEDRRNQYHLLTQHLFGQNPPVKRQFGYSGSDELVMVFCGHATGLHMAPHTVFGSSLEFLRTVDFINSCKVQFEEAGSK